MAALTPNQQWLQPFPYSMSKSDGISAWMACVVAWILAFYIFILDWGETPVFTIYSIWFLLLLDTLVSRNIYPFVYACILRSRYGTWPTITQVWGCERDKRKEISEGLAGTPVKCFSDLFRVLPSYTKLGCYLVTIIEKRTRQRAEAQAANRRNQRMEEGDESPEWVGHDSVELWKQETVILIRP